LRQFSPPGHLQAFAVSYSIRKETVPGWPQITLPVPDFRPQPASMPWEVFELSFLEDVERYL